MMEPKEIKIKYESGKFIPLGRVDFREGQAIEIVPENKDIFSWRGALKNIKLTSVELQHKMK